MARADSQSIVRALACVGRLVTDSSTVALPTVRQLAQQAGVAYVTMWKAVDRLRRNGVIDAAPRRGIRVVQRGNPGRLQTTPAPAETQTISPKWRQLCLDLRRSMLEGHYRGGSALPAAKALCQRYGVCGATLRKALAALCAEGTLQQQRTGWLVPAWPRPQGGSRVLLVAAGDQEGRLDLTITPRTAEHFRELEYTCSVRGVALSTAVWDVHGGRLHRPEELARLSTGKRDLLGVLIWQAGIDRYNWTDLVHRFAPLGVPMALFDEGGEVVVPASQLSGRHTRLYTLGYSTTAGLRMGQHLLALGHRRVAYLSPVHASVWSRNRLAGLRQAFDGAGLTDGVQAFTVDDVLLPGEFLDRSAEVREEFLAVLKGPERSGLRERARASLRLHVDPVLGREAYREAMLPLMRQALARSDFSAWVAADDDTALPCLDFLRQQGRRVPGDLSVAGFDDSLEGSIRRLTSYNYNGTAYVRAMLAHVLAPGCPESGGKGNGPVEMEGTIIVRQTTARPHRE